MSERPQRKAAQAARDSNVYNTQVCGASMPAQAPRGVRRRAPQAAARAQRRLTLAPTPHRPMLCTTPCSWCCRLKTPTSGAARPCSTNSGGTPAQTARGGPALTWPCAARFIPVGFQWRGSRPLCKAQQRIRCILCHSPQQPGAVWRQRARQAAQQRQQGAVPAPSRHAGRASLGRHSTAPAAWQPAQPGGAATAAGSGRRASGRAAQ